MSIITRLAHGLPTDKWDVHSYIPVYGELVNRWMGAHCDVLEIGVGQGGALALWERCFSSGRVVGIDIIATELEIDHFRAEILLGDASRKDVLDELLRGSTFDLIIDDGSHYPEHQVATFGALFPRLNKGGIYVIEDIQGTKFIPSLLDLCPVGWRATAYDLRRIKGRYDDLMIAYAQE